MATPSIDDKPLPGKLLKNDAVDPIHRLFGQAAPETGKSGMVGGMLIEGQPHEFLEGDPVVDLVFQLRVGIDPVPLLQEKSLQEHQG